MTPDRRTLAVSDRPNAKVERFTRYGHYRSTLKLPVGSFPIDIDYVGKYAVVGCLYGPDRSKGAPIYVLEGDRVVSTVMVKGGAGRRDLSAHPRCRAAPGQWQVLHHCPDLEPRRCRHPGAGHPLTGLSETTLFSPSDDLPGRAGAHLSETTLFQPRMICPAGQGPHLSETTLFHPRMICPAGQGPHLPETKPVSPSNDPHGQGGGPTCLKHPVSPSDDLPGRAGAPLT